MSLKEIRNQKGISQEKLVDMLYEDKYIISATVISNFENGKSIEVDTINRIAKVLDVPVKELYSNKKSEHSIQNEIMLAVSQRGCTIARSNAGRAYSKSGAVIQLFPKGWPDLTGFRHSDGKAILIEVKNEKGRLRDDQKRFAEYFKNVPFLYGVARSAEDAINIIEGK